MTDTPAFRIDSLALSAFAQRPAASGLDLSVELIVCTPYNNHSEYLGTRAALEAEGVIPAGTKWPEGFDCVSWEDGQFHYHLRRERPDGLKGPRKMFRDVDWWWFRFEPRYVDSAVARGIRRKAKELADYIRNNSQEGRAESHKQFERYLEAGRDERFQALKALIPGVNRPRRVRGAAAADARSPVASSGSSQGSKV